jgi:hypothetical protein
MMKSNNAIHEVFPYLRVNDAGRAIQFYVRAFGAVEKFRLTEPSGRIGHAELQLGPAVLMLSDAYPEYRLNAPSGDHETKPTGNPRRNSPRAALLRMPPSSRARSTCSSASLMVPLRPSSSRSLKCEG